MRYDDPRLRESLAAEYALGALHGAARARFETLLRHDPGLRRQVEAWQERLGPLAAQTPPVEPPARVWNRVQRRIRAEAGERASRTWWRRARVWQAATAASLAVAVVLAAAWVWRPVPRTVEDEAGLHYVGVLTDSGHRPVMTIMGYGPPWRLEVDARDRPPASAAQTGELRLWVRGAGAAPPRFLARLDAAGEDIRLSPARWELMSDARELIVSRDPVDSPTTGGPRGPVLFSGPCARVGAWGDAGHPRNTG